MKASVSEFERLISNLPIGIQIDLKSYLKENSINDSDSLIYKLYKDKNNAPILLFCNLRNSQLETLKDIIIYGIFGEYSLKYPMKNFLFMECSVRFHSRGIPVEILRIHAGKEKRTGKGSLAINFLEAELIPEINNILMKHKYNSKITYIYGISSDLSEDTSKISRAKFYCRNGFTMSYSHFYKQLTNDTLQQA